MKVSVSACDGGSAERAGGPGFLEFRPQRKNPAAADGRASSKTSKADGQEKIFNLWLIGLPSGGNDYLKTFWYFQHNVGEVGWGGGSDEEVPGLFFQRYYVNALLICDSFCLPMRSLTLAAWETLLSSASWPGAERRGSARPGGNRHLQVYPPGLITETNHEEKWRCSSETFCSRVLVQVSLSDYEPGGSVTLRAADLHLEDEKRWAGTNRRSAAESVRCNRGCMKMKAGVIVLRFGQSRNFPVEIFNLRPSRVPGAQRRSKQKQTDREKRMFHSQVYT